MDQIKRRLNGTLGVFKVYTKEEAGRASIKYKHWKDCKKGDWGLSDDGYVGECVSSKFYENCRGDGRSMIKFTYGLQFVGKNSKLLYEPNKKMNQYCNLKPRHWSEFEAKKTRTKNAVNAYVYQILGERGIDWAALGNIYRPDQDIPEATVRRLFKEKVIQDMVEDKLKSIMSKMGITKEFVLQTILDAIGIAKGKSDAGNMLKATSELSDYLEMRPAKRVTTDVLEFGVSRQIEDQISKEEGKIKLERKREELVPENGIKNEEDAEAGTGNDTISA